MAAVPAVLANQHLEGELERARLKIARSGVSWSAFDLFDERAQNWAKFKDEINATGTGVRKEPGMELVTTIMGGRQMELHHTFYTKRYADYYLRKILQRSGAVALLEHDNPYVGLWGVWQVIYPGKPTYRGERLYRRVIKKIRRRADRGASTSISEVRRR